MRPALSRGRWRIGLRGLAALLLGAAALRFVQGPGLTPPGESELGRTRPPRWRFRAFAAIGLGLLLLGTLGVGGMGLMASREKEAVAKALTSGDPSRAPALMTRYGCGGCHTISGVPGADGKVAGPLTGMRERVYVGGVARNTPQNMINWIVNPRAFSPNTAMPATGITETEARDVAAYLYSR
jgi:mono/diheme cytochrome c family protein